MPVSAGKRVLLMTSTTPSPRQATLRRNCAILLAALGCWALATWWLYDQAEGELRTAVLQEARLIANTIPRTSLKALSGSSADMDKAEYLEIKAHLVAARQTSDRYRFLSLIGQREDGLFFFYADSEPIGSPDESTAGMLYPDGPKVMGRVFASRLEMIDGPHTDRWGEWMTALVPLSQPDNEALAAILSLDVSADSWQAMIASRIAIPSFLLLLLSLSTGILLLFAKRGGRRKEAMAAIDQPEALPEPPKPPGQRERLRRWVRKRGGELAVIGVVVVFFLVYFAPSIFITVYPGYRGVLFKRLHEGVVEGKVFHEGLYLVAPWNILYPYNIRVHDMHLTPSVLSINGLAVGLEVSVRYYPDRERLPLLHKTVGPDYEEKVVKPVTQAAIRKVIGRYGPEEIYATEAQLIQEQILLEIISMNGRIPIVYDAFFIKTIKLPEMVQTSIENKLRAQQEYFTYEFRLKQAMEEIKRKILEAEGLHAFNNIIAGSLTDRVLTWLGVQATLELARSPNAKVVLVGGGENGLPIILNLERDAGGQIAPTGAADTMASTTANSAAKAAADDKATPTPPPPGMVSPELLQQRYENVIRSTQQTLQNNFNSVPNLQKMVNELNIDGMLSQPPQTGQ